MIEDEIEDWIFVAGEDGIGGLDNQGESKPDDQDTQDLSQSAVKEFFMDRKEDLKHIKDEAKNIFCKVKGVFTKAGGANP